MSKIENENMSSENTVVELASKELRQFKDELQQLPPEHLNKLELDASWDEIQMSTGSSQASEARSLLANSSWLSMTACAVLVAALFVDGSALQTESLQVKNGDVPVLTERQSRADIQTLKQFNQAIEKRLQALPEQPRLVRANTIDTITRLEDQIALLDYRLDMQEHEPLSAEEYRGLWQQRAKSMNGLYQVRAAQVHGAQQQAPTYERVAYYE